MLFLVSMGGVARGISVGIAQGAAACMEHKQEQKSLSSVWDTPQDLVRDHHVSSDPRQRNKGQQMKQNTFSPQNIEVLFTVCDDMRGP